MKIITENVPLNEGTILTEKENSVDEFIGSSNGSTLPIGGGSFPIRYEQPIQRGLAESFVRPSNFVEPNYPTYYDSNTLPENVSQPYFSKEELARIEERKKSPSPATISTTDLPIANPGITTVIGSGGGSNGIPIFLGGSGSSIDSNLLLYIGLGLAVLFLIKGK